MCQVLIRHDAATGKLYWRKRDRSWFSADRYCNAWNAKWAEKEAFTNLLGNGYRQGEILGVPFYAHRVIWAIKNGEWPNGVIDHRNRSRQFNKTDNLRDVTREQNQRNMKRNARNKSGVNGVFWNNEKKCWTARIRSGGKYIHLGHYSDLSLAAEARRLANLKYNYYPGHGDGEAA
jgi:hypothetical protein